MNETKQKHFCCSCGVEITPNEMNQCTDCLRSQIDITEDIPKQYTLHSCNKCERFWQPPSAWINAELESKELMSICLKKLKGLNKVTLLHASFIWTEPHSKRVKVKLILQKSVNNTQLQQTTIVEFTIVNKICEDCQRIEAKDFWNVVVQVRQHVSHKKTFYYLEQLIIKMNMYQHTVRIKQVNDGIDLYFANQQDSRRVMEFLESVVPCRYTMSKHLISQDLHKNTYNFKYTYSVEIVPICKDDVVCLPAKLRKENGNIGPICICTHITRLIHLIDPRTLRTLEIDGNCYWRTPFLSISTSKQLRKFVVMDIETSKLMKSKISKYLAADAWVMKASELGKSEQQYHTKTHLGYLLNAGDAVLGFDLANANLNNTDIDLLNKEDLPDIVLVKKTYTDDAKRHRLKLKRLDIDRDESVASSGEEDQDYLDFLEDVEHDAKLKESLVVIEEEIAVGGLRPETET